MGFSPLGMLRARKKKKSKRAMAIILIRIIRKKEEGRTNK
jgi:hypothetical protein